MPTRLLARLEDGGRRGAGDRPPRRLRPGRLPGAARRDQRAQPRVLGPDRPAAAWASTTRPPRSTRRSPRGPVRRSGQEAGQRLRRQRPRRRPAVPRADSLVLTGIATSGVVLSTLRQAADLDYGLTVLVDACADADPEVHRVLTEKVFPRQAPSSPPRRGDRLRAAGRSRGRPLEHDLADTDLGVDHQLGTRRAEGDGAATPGCSGRTGAHRPRRPRCRCRLWALTVTDRARRHVDRPAARRATEAATDPGRRPSGTWVRSIVMLPDGQPVGPAAAGRRRRLDQTRCPIPPVRGTPVRDTAPRKAPAATMTRLTTTSARTSSTRPAVGRRDGRRRTATTTANSTGATAGPEPAAPPGTAPPRRAEDEPDEERAGEQQAGEPRWTGRELGLCIGLARPVVRPRPRRCSTGHERPHGQVDDHPQAPEEGHDHEGHPDDGDVDVEPVGDPAGTRRRPGGRATAARPERGRWILRYRRDPRSAGASRVGRSSTRVMAPLWTLPGPGRIGNIPVTGPPAPGASRGSPPSPPPRPAVRGLAHRRTVTPPHRLRAQRSGDHRRPGAAPGPHRVPSGPAALLGPAPVLGGVCGGLALAAGISARGRSAPPWSWPSPGRRRPRPLHDAVGRPAGRRRDGVDRSAGPRRPARAADRARLLDGVPGPVLSPCGRSGCTTWTCRRGRSWSSPSAP